MEFDFGILWDALTGPAGALLVMAFVIISLVKWRYIVPGYVYEGQEARLKLLDEENARFASTVGQLSIQNAKLEARVDALNEQIERLNQKILEGHL